MNRDDDEIDVMQVGQAHNILAGTENATSFDDHLLLVGIVVHKTDHTIVVLGDDRYFSRQAIIWPASPAPTMSTRVWPLGN